MMISKYTFANLLLFVAVVVLGFKNYEVWTHPMLAAPRNETYKGPEKKPETPPMMTEAQGEKISSVSFKMIAEKNIFSPERKDFPIAPPVAINQNVRPKVRPQVILNCVAIAEDYQAATITSPGRALRKGEREATTLKIGERIGEYSLARVLPDRIALENGNDSFEVLLYDPKKPKRRADTRTETKPSGDATTPPPASSPSPGAPPVPDPSAVSPSPGVPPRIPPPALAAAPGAVTAPLPSEVSLEKPEAPARQQLSQPPLRYGRSRIPPSSIRWQPSPSSIPFPIAGGSSGPNDTGLVRIAHGAQRSPFDRLRTNGESKGSG